MNTVAVAAAKAAAAPGAKPALASTSPPQGFPLKGVLSQASANQVAELNGYSSGRAEVAIDMEKVLRIDLAYATTFFEVARSLQTAGKRVIRKAPAAGEAKGE